MTYANSTAPYPVPTIVPSLMHGCDDSAFFYVEGIPTNGIWINLDRIEDWEDVRIQLLAAELIEEDFDGDIQVACTQGILAGCAHITTHDFFDLDEYLSLKETAERLGVAPVALEAFIFHYGSWDADEFENAYIGEYGSEEDFAEQLLGETGLMHEVPEQLQSYIDVEAFARDLFMDGYWFESGHVFCH